MSTTPFFTVDEFRARYGADVVDFADADITAARDLAESVIEDATRTAWTPGTETVVVYADGGLLRLPRRPVRGVVAVAASAAAVEIATATVQGDVVMGVWPRQTALTVTYAYGADAPPLRLKRAAMVYAKHELVDGPIDDRTVTAQTDTGGTLTFAVPGLRGSITGIPEVDAAIAQYRVPTV